MKTCLFLIASLLAIETAVAQTNNNPPQATGSAWLDLFASPDGVVVYPQYGWSVRTSAGGFSGYGFVESAPHEPFFTNHLVVYTPPKMPWLSVYTEMGGAPAKSSWFFQAGPRVNLHEAFTPLKKPAQNLFVAALPRSTTRPDNYLVAGATNRFRIARGVQVSVEGFRRFFPGKHPDYGEYWFLVHPQKTKHISFAAHLLHDGDRMLLSGGIRISP